MNGLIVALSMISFSLMAVALYYSNTTFMVEPSSLSNVYAAEGKDENQNKDQLASETNYCANGDISANVFCQNEGSEIQGNENTVGLSGQQQVQSTPTPTPTPEPTTCEECFRAALTADEIAAFEAFTGYLTEGDISTIGELCEYLLTANQIDVVTDLQVRDKLSSAGIPIAQVDQIIECLVRLGVIISDPEIPIISEE